MPLTDEQVFPIQRAVARLDHKVNVAGEELETERSETAIYGLVLSIANAFVQLVDITQATREDLSVLEEPGGEP